MPSKTSYRPLPTGFCWCGCGRETPVGSFFAPGHDKVAESRIISREYGTVPEFLVAHEYDPAGDKWLTWEKNS